MEKDFITAGEKKKKTDVGSSQDLNLNPEPQADALSKRITGIDQRLVLYGTQLLGWMSGSSAKIPSGCNRRTNAYQRCSLRIKLFIYHLKTFCDFTIYLLLQCQSPSVVRAFHSSIGSQTVGRRG